MPDWAPTELWVGSQKIATDRQILLVNRGRLDKVNVRTAIKQICGTVSAPSCRQILAYGSLEFVNTQRTQLATMSIAPNSCATILLAIAAVLLTISPSAAHVVIDNIDLGEGELDAAEAIEDSGNERVTGELEELTLRETSGDWNFVPTTRSGDRRRADGRRIRSIDRLRSPRSVRSAGSGGGAGGGGGGSRRARRDSRQQDGGREMIQTVVAVNNDTGEMDPNADGDPGLNVSLLDSGENAPGGSGAGGNGGGGAGGANGTPEDGEDGTDYPDTAGPRGIVVSGTPEPAAMVVWAVVGCCGFGFVLYKNKQNART